MLGIAIYRAGTNKLISRCPHTHIAHMYYSVLLFGSHFLTILCAVYTSHTGIGTPLPAVQNSNPALVQVASTGNTSGSAPVNSAWQVCCYMLLAAAMHCFAIFLQDQFGWHFASKIGTKHFMSVTVMFSCIVRKACASMFFAAFRSEIPRFQNDSEIRARAPKHSAKRCRISFPIKS